MLDKDSQRTQKLSRSLRSYLQTVLHISVNLEPWKESAALPIFLARSFDFYQGELLSTPCIFAIVPVDENLTPSELEKRLSNLRKHHDGVIIFVFEQISSHVRARLIERALPFIVPDNQLYLPPLALDLREYFRAKMPTSSDSLSPAGQVVLFRHLLRTNQDTWSPSNLAKKLRYSAMTIGRAFEELATYNLAHIEPLGRSKLLVFDLPHMELFERARPLLRSPVKATHFYRAKPIPDGFHGTPLPQSLPAGGEMALSERSMLNPPRLPHYAVGPRDWENDFGEEVQDRDDASFGIDVWRYDPDIVTGDNKADPLSLYMQFHVHEDERVADAANHLMETLHWSEA